MNERMVNSTVCVCVSVCGLEVTVIVLDGWVHLKKLSLEMSDAGALSNWKQSYQRCQ